MFGAADRLVCWEDHVNQADRTLEGRFMAFLEQLEGAESIDDTWSDAELSHGKRADFLLDQRRIVLEIKSLQADPEYKVEERLSAHRGRPEFPAFYWESDLKGDYP